MRLWKKLLLGFIGVCLALTVLVVTFIGPWPTYSDGFEGMKYFQDNLALIDQHSGLNEITETPDRLKAGWAVCLMNPEAGVPMAGYGARHDIREYLFGRKPTMRATGVHDSLYVKALALSDGKDTVVIVGSDMLLVPPNVAEGVRAEVAKQTPLTANNILFTASHTHDGPGGWGPGLAAFVTGGKFDPKVVSLLTQSFTQAIVDAYNNLQPAKFAHGSIEAPEYIRNRAHGDTPIDTRLSFLAVEKDDGKRCVFVRYSAHPTTVGHKFLEFTAEFPGALQAALERDLPNTTVGYIGGSLGSSGPRAPEVGSDIERARAMGEALASLVRPNLDTAKLSWQTNVDIASIGIPLELPPFQLRVSQKLRLSPLLPKLLGVPHEAWMQGVRVGDLVLIGLPGDFSGEISLDWAKWASSQGLDLWSSSFCTSYIGYISPDKYYNMPEATADYETGLMSWTGPHQEAFFTALMKRTVDGLTKRPKS